MAQGRCVERDREESQRGDSEAVSNFLIKRLCPTMKEEGRHITPSENSILIRGGLPLRCTETSRIVQVRESQATAR